MLFSDPTQFMVIIAIGKSCSIKSASTVTAPELRVEQEKSRRYFGLVICRDGNDVPLHFKTFLLAICQALHSRHQTFGFEFLLDVISPVLPGYCYSST